MNALVVLAWREPPSGGAPLAFSNSLLWQGNLRLTGLIIKVSSPITRGEILPQSRAYALRNSSRRVFHFVFWERLLRWTVAYSISSHAVRCLFR